jgi:hypothetical protein
MARTNYRARSRAWTTAGTAGLLVACNAVLGMEELPQASDASAGRAGKGGNGGGKAGSGNTSGRGGNGVSGQAQAGDGGGESGGEGGAAGSGGEAGEAGGTAGSSGRGGAGMGGSGGTSQVCLPNSRVCVDGRALHCSADGSDYDSDVECTSDETCVAGSCEEHQCEPGNLFCSASDVRKCASDGLSSVVTDRCDTNEYCDAASATCKEGVCAPNEPACNVNVAATCNADGSGYLAGGMACDAGATCESGSCVTHVCTPDTVFCQGQELQRCASNGLSSTVVDTCDTDEYCTAQDGGSCQNQVCSPGTKACSGNTSQTCNEAGSGTMDTSCTDGFCDASSGECRTPAEIVGALDGRLVQLPCSDSISTDDCTSSGVVVAGVTTPCTGGSVTAVVNHPIGGTPGAQYQATIHFYGIVEPKVYGSNVTREAGPTRPSDLATGASPAPWATAAPGASFVASDYGTYEIHVLDQNNTEQAQYFLNSDTQEGHWTYVLDFTKTITVIGGGTVRLRVYDRNCRIIKNCTTGPYPCAAKARSVDISAANPQPAFTQPGLGRPDDHSGQWLMLDVTAVQ